MPAEVIRIGDERIVLATLTGTLTLEDTLYVYEETKRLRADDEGEFWRITDTSDVVSTIAEFSRILQEAHLRSPNGTADDNLNVVFVGYSQWVKLFVDGVQKRTNKRIPIFYTQDDALAYVRNQLQTA